MRMHLGQRLGRGAGTEWRCADPGGDSRVPVALRQPSRCLLTQKGYRHGAKPKQGFRAVTGTCGQSGRDSGDHGIAQVTCPRQSRQPGLQSCSHRASSRVQCVGGVRPLQPAPPQGQLPSFQRTICREAPGLKGQHPEPQPASCHQGPGHLC